MKFIFGKIVFLEEFLNEISLLYIWVIWDLAYNGTYTKSCSLFVIPEYVDVATLLYQIFKVLLCATLMKLQKIPLFLQYLFLISKHPNYLSFPLFIFVISLMFACWKLVEFHPRPETNLDILQVPGNYIERKNSFFQLPTTLTG